MRTYIRIFVPALLMVFSIAQCNATPATDFFDEGKAVFSSGKTAEAIELFSRAIALNPEVPLFFEWRAEAYYHAALETLANADYGDSAYVGILRKSESDLDSAIRLDPQSDGSYFLRGSLHETLGRWDKAIVDYSRAIAIRPTYADAYVGRSQALCKKKKYPLAIADSELAINLVDSDKALPSSRSAAAFINRGDIYCQQGEFEKALSDYNTALVRIPNKPLWKPLTANCRVHRAAAFYKSGAFQAAIDDCTEAHNLCEESPLPTIFITRGRSYMAMGQPQQALIDFTTAIDTAKDYAEAYYERSKVYRQLGMSELSKRDLRIAKRLGWSSSTEHN